MRSNEHGLDLDSDSHHNELQTRPPISGSLEYPASSTQQRPPSPLRLGKRREKQKQEMMEASGFIYEECGAPRSLVSRIAAI